MTEKKPKKKKKDAKLGSLSKSLISFLSYDNHTKRKKKYGKKTAKYYERVIDNVNESFKDALTLIRSRLPDEYKEKINFNEQCSDILTEAVKYKWVESVPGVMLIETIEHLENMRNELGSIQIGELKKQRIKNLADDDFKKVIDWLYHIKDLKTL